MAYMRKKTKYNPTPDPKTHYPPSHHPKRTAVTSIEIRAIKQNHSTNPDIAEIESRLNSTNPRLLTELKQSNEDAPIEITRRFRHGDTGLFHKSALTRALERRGIQVSMTRYMASRGTLGRYAALDLSTDTSPAKWISRVLAYWAFEPTPGDTLIRVRSTPEIEYLTNTLGVFVLVPTMATAMMRPNGTLIRSGESMNSAFTARPTPSTDSIATSLAAIAADDSSSSAGSENEGESDSSLDSTDTSDDESFEGEKSENESEIEGERVSEIDPD